MQTLLREAMENTAREERIKSARRPIRDFLENKTENEEFVNTDYDMNNDQDIASFLRQSLPKIQVFGVGGMGCNATLRLKSLNISGVEIVALNTDAQDLLGTKADKKLLIGSKKTRGFGAGNNPVIGEAAAQESIDQVKQMIDGNLMFVTCGLGGGTGTGAAPLIAKAAKEKDVLTISICTMPFIMEGPYRLRNAKEGLKRLYENSDTVIIVPNERLLSLANDITLIQAFKISDEVLIRAVSAITELITEPQMINLDFADVRKILGNGGIAMIGYGQSTGNDNKVEEAVREALHNPLLSDMDISTARKALICVSGGEDLGLKEAEEAVYLISKEIETDAEIIWGAAVQPDLNGSVRVIVVLSDVRSPILESDITVFDDDIDQILSDVKQGFTNDLSKNFENRNWSQKRNNNRKNVDSKSKNNNSFKKLFRRLG